MSARLLQFLIPLVVLVPLQGQDYFPHHNFTFGSGAQRPRGDIGSLFGDAPGIAVGYGYRFHRYFQADIGLDILFGAAGVRDFLNTGIGPFRIKDREYFPSFGGRAIIPLARGRFLVSGGAGGTWMKYAERVSQPSDYYRVGCPVCTSRDGWGYYALGNASYFLNRNQNFRVGATTKVVRGHTDGEAVGPLPGVRTRDKWLQIFAEFGFSF